MLIYHDLQVSSGISPDCHFRRDITEGKEASIIRKQEDTHWSQISQRTGKPKQQFSGCSTGTLTYRIDKVSQGVFPNRILRSLLVALLVQLLSSTVIANLLYVWYSLDSFRMAISSWPFCLLWWDSSSFSSTLNVWFPKDFSLSFLFFSLVLCALSKSTFLSYLIQMVYIQDSLSKWHILSVTINTFVI